MTLKKLNNLITCIDTGLKAVTFVELSQSDEIDAGSIARNLIDYGCLQIGKNGLRKKQEAIKTALDGLTRHNLAIKHDTGEFKFQTPRHTYQIKDPDNLVVLAKHLLYHTSVLGIPYHDLLSFNGGSFSNGDKHIRQGMQLASFYGVPISSIEQSVQTDFWEYAEDKTLLSSEFAKLIGEDEKLSRSYLTRFVQASLVEAVKNLTIEQLEAEGKELSVDSKGRSGVGRTQFYNLSQQAKYFVVEDFIPALAYVIFGANPKVEESAVLFDKNQDDITKRVLDLHYKYTTNQFN
jgi:hypothetical protein